MPADHHQFGIAQARANVGNDGNIINNYRLGGGRGGAGGEGRNGAGGEGGQGMDSSPSLTSPPRDTTKPLPGQGILTQIRLRHRIDILHRSVALEAIHDSAESFPQPRCHPDTRTQMLRHLQGWALNGIDPESDMDSESDVESESNVESESDSESSIFAMDGPADPETNILWLYGPAGAGKSAIMQTLAAQLRDAGRLGGSFFFKRGHAMRGNAKTLFATIAYQLALAVPWLRTPISQIVENDPSIVVRSIAIQIKTLISDPCRSYVHENCDPVVILIDGLDECEGQEVQEEILHAIQHSSKHPIHLRFILASRPEAHIREVFNSAVYAGSYRSFNVEQSFEDVRKYLRDEFLRIHREHRTMAKIPVPWPSWDVLEQLVDNSSGHFIYAATIIKFIDDKNYRPTERLEVVQNPNSSGLESAFDTLDQLYMTILHSAQRQSELIPILCAISYFQLVASDIDQLFELAEGETRLLLRGLHSLLDVPSESEDNADDGYDKHSISLHHASFGDFLRNPDRSGDFCVGPFQRRRTWLLSRLIHFIVSLPPSDAVAELFPLIGSINPDYIFDQGEILSSYNDKLASWLKNMRSPPTDVIELWEDYAFMVSIDNMPWSAFKQNVLPSPELLRIFVLLGFLHHQLFQIPIKLDLSWTDLRTTLCSLRSKSVGDAQVLPVHQPQTALPLVARDLALQLIRKMVKNHIDTDGGVNPSASRDAVLLFNHSDPSVVLEAAYTRSQYELGCDISHLVRLSPPCPVLYRELWSIPPSEIWSFRPSGYALIHHVSKWLESFPDSMMELITLWQQALPDHDRHRISLNLDPNDEERYWHHRVKRYNNTIVRLNLPDSLKIIL
ncbi:putative nwd2 protein [Mycena sanguinolenta]|uniref:Putative nwd2 protein n=1 Tax=Mycena sanguinolenta TaxID=230812 RepID=A0A8H6X6B8_9AGAR|nr:putative nwd2 protein [Mycena sanguinolenta]